MRILTLIIVALVMLVTVFAILYLTVFIRSDNVDIPPVVQQPEATPTPLPQRPPQQPESPRLPLTKDDFLADFDNMFGFMEINFPYFGVIERRLGVDIFALAQNTRAIIENYPYSVLDIMYELGMGTADVPELDSHVFWGILWDEFFRHFEGIGHAYILDYVWYRDYMLSNVFWEEVYRFFLEQERYLMNHAEFDPVMSEFVYRSYIPRSFDEADGVVLTEIVEDGTIAYIRVPSHFNPRQDVHDSRRNRNILLDFYSEIQGYDNLIIDVRDTVTAHSDYMAMLLIYPLLTDDHHNQIEPLYAFYRGDEFGEMLYEYFTGENAPVSTRLFELGKFQTAEDLIAANNLHLFNEADLAYLRYGHEVSISFDNLTGQSLSDMIGGARPPSYPFEGQVWLLTSGANTSGAVTLAMMSRTTGFATLVGETAHGSYLGLWLYHIELPHSWGNVTWAMDYLTDQYGRAFEEFPIEPDYYNRPGMDALETTLALIAEGR